MLPTLFIAAIASLASASPARTNARRDVITAEDIVAAVQGIDVGVNNLKAALEAYNGGLLSQTPILGAFGEIEVANRAGYAEALLASNFTAAGSDEIVQAVQDTVAIDIPACVQVTKDKKSLFEAQDEGSVILGSLQVLLYDHQSFSDAVLAHLTSEYDEGLAAVNLISDALQSGIEYYSD